MTEDEWVEARLAEMPELTPEQIHTLRRLLFGDDIGAPVVQRKMDDPNAVGRAEDEREAS
jgi:hypothetical protein